MPRPRVATAEAPRSSAMPESPKWTRRLVDAGLVVALLALTASLGVFTLRDTDFWWHLRTGDLIRQTGSVPRTDWYTYTVPDRPWIDLHWGFEVLISWGYALAGVVALNVAKIAITAASVLLLVTARKREWPIGVMVLSWIPAILVLGGREYIRPETLSLLYLAIDLAVLFRIDQKPKLAFVLPIVQLFWVNTQGIFVLGPILIGAAILDAALRRGAFAPERRTWWRTVLLATALTGFACLLNPYGLIGALFPIELAKTMGDPVFAEQIAELTPIPKFIDRHGLSSLPLQLHLFTMLLGGLGFLIPIVWRIATGPEPGPKVAENNTKRKKSKKTAPIAPPSNSWSLSPFRILLYLAFSVLSLKATRNTHQFAAVVGTITAWNFGEWAAAVDRRRKLVSKDDIRHRGFVIPVIGYATLGVLVVAVLSGTYYRICAEGRVVGLGEDRLWFAHDAAKFATRSGMPDRGLVFHNGLASLYDYYGGPEKKVFADARLEVIGSELFQRYLLLERDMSRDEPGWEAEIGEGGWPVVLLDNVQGSTSGVAATLMRRSNWRCVWFDPVATVFLRREDAEKARAPAVDFDARHYLGDPSGPKDYEALFASAKALRNQSGTLLDPKHLRRDLASPLITLGLDHARKAARLRPDSAEALRMIGQLESFRDPRLGGAPIARYRMPFDPVFDIPTVTATYDLLRASAIQPDFSTSMSLAMLFDQRSMHEQSVPWFERLTAIEPINPQQSVSRKGAIEALSVRSRALGAPARLEFANSDELDRLLESLLDRGRVASAAELLERAYPNPAGRPWPMTDRMATLRLHLGQPDRARALWASAINPPRPAVRDARIAAALLIEGSIDAARASYLRALDAEPALFEALYGLALLESDAGRAVEAFSAADRAVKAAPGEAAKNAAGAIEEAAGKFAKRN